MSKLCLSTYLKVLIINKLPENSGQSKILNALINCLIPNSEFIKASEVSKIVNGIANLSLTIRDEIHSLNYTNPNYLDNYHSKVYGLLNPSKIDDIAKILAIIIQDDPNIDNECVIDYVLQKKKGNLNNITNSIDFIAGVFLFVLKCTNNYKTTAFSNEITESYCKNAVDSYNQTFMTSYSSEKAATIIMDSDLPSQAKRFCRTYEDSIELLPLCQIANIVNPDHNHINEMYSAYCDCSDALKKQIMSDHNIPMIQVEDKYVLYNLLGNFTADIEKYGLSSNDKSYMFAQYVPRSLEYEAVNPILIDLPIFPIKPTHFLQNRTTSYLSQFVNDYLFYKDKDKDFPIPFDWMWENLTFATCSTEDLIIWLNLFIASSCYDIQAQNKTMSKDVLNIPSLEYANTIEDLHFLALLLLYDTYLNE